MDDHEIRFDETCWYLVPDKMWYRSTQLTTAGKKNRSVLAVQCTVVLKHFSVQDCSFRKEGAHMATLNYARCTAAPITCWLLRL